MRDKTEYMVVEFSKATFIYGIIASIFIALGLFSFVTKFLSLYLEHGSFMNLPCQGAFRWASRIRSSRTRDKTGSEKTLQKSGGGKSIFVTSLKMQQKRTFQ